MRTACLTFAALVAASGVFAATARACPDHLHPPQGISSLPPASAYQPLRPVAMPRRVYAGSNSYAYVAPTYPLVQPRATYVPRATYTPSRYVPARYPRRYVYR